MIEPAKTRRVWFVACAIGDRGEIIPKAQSTDAGVALTIACGIELRDGESLVKSVISDGLPHPGIKTIEP